MTTVAKTTQVQLGIPEPEPLVVLEVVPPIANKGSLMFVVVMVIVWADVSTTLVNLT